LLSGQYLLKILQMIITKTEVISGQPTQQTLLAQITEDPPITSEVNKEP
jgi:hypothetical protein